MADASLTHGSPQFADTRLAALASTEGALAAWREAVRNDAAGAAARVTGAFSVGLHEPDGRSFIAVDRFAVHSMCYRVTDGRLHFAASADDLLDAGADADLDLQALFDYLYFHVIPSPRTIYKGIFRLPAGHYGVFEQGRLTIAPYWTPTFNEVAQPSFPALKTEFLGLLRDSVASQLVGGQAACFLSGGTDSSTIAGMLALVSDRPPATYSIGFDAQGYDEMEFARIASRHFKTEHHEYYVTPDDLLANIPAVAAYYDQPFGNSSALPAYCCALRARDDGVTKLLAGDGGDELFGGNTRYAKQKVFGWYDGIPAGLRHALLEPLADNALMGKLPLLRKAASYVNQAKVSMPERMMTYNLLQRLGVSDVLTPALLEQVDQQGPQRQQRELWGQAHTDSLVNRMLAFDWRYTLADCDLPKVMGTTALAGVAVGFPMLDDRLLDFSLKLPTDYKLHGQKLRWFFKEALRGFLPDEILTKKKQGFGLPFGVWANSHAGLKALATESLQSLAARGIVRPEFARTLISQHLPAHPGYYGEMVWILMMLEQWLVAKAPRFSLKG